MNVATGAIPLVVLEEHHEAFFAWHYALRHKWINPQGNTLLHADSHADLMTPRLRRPLDSIGDLSDLANFTYRELDITNFIWPAVYQGIFSRVLFLKYRHRLSSGGWRSMTICSKNAFGTEFFVASSLLATPHAGATDARAIDYSPVTPFERLSTDRPIVLDIDLDYFCCNDYPAPFRPEIEITRSEFEEFNGNRYHYLRLCPSDKVSAVARSGRYYFVFHDYHSQQPAPESRETAIQERMRDFISYLQAYDVRPPLISMCRSFYSGYTPAEWVDHVQTTLMSRLAELYRLEIFSIDDLMPADALREATVPAGVL